MHDLEVVGLRGKLELVVGVKRETWSWRGRLGLGGRKDRVWEMGQTETGWKRRFRLVGQDTRLGDHRRKWGKEKN